MAQARVTGHVLVDFNETMVRDKGSGAFIKTTISPGDRMIVSDGALLSGVAVVERISEIPGNRQTYELQLALDFDTFTDLAGGGLCEHTDCMDQAVYLIQALDAQERPLGSAHNLCPAHYWDGFTQPVEDLWTHMGLHWNIRVIHG